MRVSREKAAQHRERIIDAAGALFRAKGFGGIGVADIMKAADLTHGGFYGHFASKDDLVAQASRRTMARAAENWSKRAAADPDAPFAALLEHYLHHAIAMTRAKAAPLPRSATMRRAAARSSALHLPKGWSRSIDILAQSIPGRSKATRRRKALAAMATLVGALTLARAVEGAHLSDDILDATRRELLGSATEPRK